MRFMVKRTSAWEDERPCEEARREDYTLIDKRNVNDPKKIPISMGSDGKWWYEEGTNHRVEGGHIKRDFPATGWFVELDSLEALLDFRNKHGKLVLGWAWENEDIPSIEIYDTYRE